MFEWNPAKSCFSHFWGVFWCGFLVHSVVRENPLKTSRWNFGILCWVWDNPKSWIFFSRGSLGGFSFLKGFCESTGGGNTEIQGIPFPWNEKIFPKPFHDYSGIIFWSNRAFDFLKSQFSWTVLMSLKIFDGSWKGNSAVIIDCEKNPHFFPFSLKSHKLRKVTGNVILRYTKVPVNLQVWVSADLKWPSFNLWLNSCNHLSHPACWPHPQV